MVMRASSADRVVQRLYGENVLSGLLSVTMVTKKGVHAPVWVLLGGRGSCTSMVHLGINVLSKSKQFTAKHTRSPW